MSKNRVGRPSWLMSLGAATVLALASSSVSGAEIGHSTQRVDSEGNGAASMAFDGDLATSWVEGAPGMGRGEWLQVRFDKGGRALQNVTLFAGKFASEAAFFEHAHVEKATISWTPTEGEPASLTIDIPDAYTPVVVPVNAIVQELRITVDGVYDGARYSEAHVAEVAFDWGVVDEKITAGLERYRASRQGKAAAEAEAKAQADALSKLSEPEGLADAIPVLTAAVARGSDVDRGWLARNVPPGFMLTYLRADVAAVEALGQAKVVSALAALQQAAAREWDAARRPGYIHLAQWMAAYQEYSAPQPTAVPFWGSKGSVPGTFQSLGEPLSIAVGADGSVFVADVGNNRLQRFDGAGRIRGTSMGKRTIATDAFGKPVDPYVVGAAPGDGPGVFRTPLYLTLAHDNGEERLVVVDASQRIQVLTADFKPLASWVFPEPGEILTGIGLRWPLVVELKEGFIAVIVKDLAVVYDLKGVEQWRFQLEGEPIAATAIKKRLLVAYGGDEVISYTFEGQRDKVFYKLPKEDRSEDLDLTVDEEGVVLIHTDAAFAYQLDKRGRLVQVQRTFKTPTYPFRIAARAGILYVTAKDSIHRFELLAVE